MSNDDFMKEVIHNGPSVKMVRGLSSLEQFQREQDAIRPNNLWNPMLPPATENSNDDEFNDQSLSPNWTEFDPAGRLTITEPKYGLLLTKVAPVAGHEIAGLYKTLPAGNFTITTHWINLGPANGTYDFGGLCLWENPANVASKLWTWGGDRYNQTIRIHSYSWTNYTTVGAASYGPTSPPYLLSDSCFFRLRRTGTNYYIDYSISGLGWQSPNAFAAITLGFTPTAYGLYTSVWNGGSGTTYQVYSFIRYLASDIGLYGMLEGNRK